MSNNKNTIVTSIYQLKYDPVRGGEVYKNFPLLTETIRALFYDDYNYVIYTDQKSCDQFQLKELFSSPNITIKIKELNSPEFLEKIEPIRIKRVAEGEIWERLYAVVGYTEVVLNKLDNMLEVSKETGGNVVWLDAGLFGTSCDNAWRDLMKDKFVHCKNFLDKIFEKVEQYGFIATKGNSIVVNYEVRERLQQITNANVSIIPGCLFGGNAQKNIEILSGYNDIYLSYVQKYGQLVSEQELLSVMINDKDVKFFEFNDWNDLQKAFLNILDEYREEDYKTDKCYCAKIKTRDVLEEIINLKVKDLNELNFNHNDDILKNMSVFALHFKSLAGVSHYRLLSQISKFLNDEVIYDIGSNNGCSALALSENPLNSVLSYDVTYFEETKYIKKPNVSFFVDDILKDHFFYKKTRFIMLDTNHDGIFENKFYNHLKDNNYKGLLFCDDIHLNDQMEDFWNNVSHEKYDITHLGHDTGSGIIIFE